MNKYTKWQQKYADLMHGNCHACAIEIIGELERGLRAKDEMLICYRLNKQPTEKTFNALERFKDFDTD